MSNANSTPSTPAASVSPATTATPTAKPADTSKQPVSSVVSETKGAPQAEETFDVQIDGKPQKKTRKEIIEAYQLRQLSDKKRSEAERILAEYKQLQEVSKKDPIKFMKAMGYDFEGLATSYLAKKAEDSMKDPKVLEAEQTKAELEQYKKWVSEQKTAQEQKAKTEAINQERQRIQKEIVEAIEEKKELGFPIDEHLIIQIAQEMMIQDKAKKPLNAKEALPATYARTQKWLQGLASKMEGEALVKWLGDDVAKKIRKYDLTQLKAKRSAPAQPQSAVKPQASKEAPKQKPYKLWSDFKRETLDNIK
jgi:hypothetical protein